MKKTEIHTIEAISQGTLPQQAIRLQGWVKNRRIGKQMTFITLQDGSTQQPIQVVIPTAQLNENLTKSLHIGCSIEVIGQVIETTGRQQSREIQAENIHIIGDCPLDYPLQPKRHSMEFLRTIQHLRFRTSTFRAIFRIRHVAAQAIHSFFHQRGFVWVHTPIITNIDTEGAGETFQVTSLHDKDKKDFFGQPAHLTVSGQLAGEAAALGLGNIYTFGPTFRAENSNTTRHLAEFWMIEPEMPFYDLNQTIELAQAFFREVTRAVIEACPQELAFLDQNYYQQSEESQKGLHLQAYLRNIANQEFKRITYSEALVLLQNAVSTKAKRFKYPVGSWGIDLQKEHETYLTDHFGGGVIVTDYPASQKPFYMRQNDDGKSVAAMDILLPKIGEMMGGSQREERYDRLLAAMQKSGLTSMDWYLDTRRFGSVPHSGFGLGFERFVQFLTGMENIRDVIPFPRTPGSMFC